MIPDTDGFEEFTYLPYFIIKNQAWGKQLFLQQKQLCQDRNLWASDQEESKYSIT